MSYKPIPTRIEGVNNERQTAIVEDDTVLEVMRQVLDQLKIVNIQLALITKEEITTLELRSL